MARGIGGGDGKAVALLRLKIWIAGQCDLAIGGVDAQESGIGAAQGVDGRPRRDVAGIGGDGGVDHLAGAGVLLDGSSHRAGGDGGCVRIRG